MLAVAANLAPETQVRSSLEMPTVLADSVTAAAGDTMTSVLGNKTGNLMPIPVAADESCICCRSLPCPGPRAAEVSL